MAPRSSLARDHPNHRSPSPEHLLDTGQQTTWRAWWEHATILSGGAGDRDYDLEGISHEEAAQVAAELVTLCWPPEAARLPWVTAAYPGGA